MPSVKVYINKVVGFKEKTYVYSNTSRQDYVTEYYDQHMLYDEELFLSCHLCFLFNENFKNYIPSNAQIKAVNLSFYVTNINWENTSSSELLPLYFAHALNNAIFSQRLEWKVNTVISKQLRIGYNLSLIHI